MSNNNCVESLDEQQREALQKFKQLLVETGIATQFRERDMCDAMCLRWLRARKFDIDKSLDMIKCHVEWRQKTQVEQYHMDMCHSVLDTDACTFMGVDKLGRTAIVVTPGKHTPGSLPLDQVEALMVLALEVAIRNLRCGNEHFVLIFDYEGWGLRNVDKGVDNIILTVGQNNYPERLIEAILVQPPWYFSTVWAVVKLFLDEKTKSKFIFLTRNVNEELAQKFDADQLLEKFGGTSKGTTVRQYLTSKMRDDKETLGEYIDRVIQQELASATSQQQQQQQQEEEEGEEVSKSDSN